MNLYPFGKTVTYLFACAAFKMRYEGLENIPENQGFILACNHITAIDPFFIAYKIPQQLHFMAKIELFKNKFLGWILRRVNAFPVDRGAGDSGALDEAKKRIDNGGALGIFVEGHRSPDGKPKRARSGVALIAGRTGADIMPCAIVCERKPKFRSIVTVRYGSLIKNESLNIDLQSPSTLRLAAKSVMDDIVRLFYSGMSGEDGPDAC